MSSRVGRVIVYGGKGALGSVCVQHFKEKNWLVGSIDLAPNDNADFNVLVQPTSEWNDQSDGILKQVQENLNGEKIDALLCVAGGWAGGNAADKDLIKNSELMWKQSVWSSVIAAQIASQHMRDGGVLQLTGAKAALEGTAGMIGYGMAKAAVHQLVKSLAATKSGMPNNSLAVAILPVTLDTPMNRKWMPKADHSSWTPLEYVADLLYKWSSGIERPNNGSLVQLVTKGGETQLISD